MAAKRIQLELCAPSHAPVVFETDEVVIPGTAGIFTVLPGHTPLLTTLGIGVVTAYENEAQPRIFAVHDGFAEILADRVILLADTMELAENIDISRAEAAAERAQERLRKRSEDTDAARAQVALARSAARLQALAGHDF